MISRKPSAIKFIRMSERKHCPRASTRKRSVESFATMSHVKQMRRIVLNNLAILSALLCLLTIYWCVASRSAGRDVSYTTAAHTIYTVYAYPNGVHFLRSTNRSLQPVGWDSVSYPRGQGSSMPPAAFFGHFSWTRQISVRRGRPPIVTTVVLVPYWAAVLSTAAAAGAFALAARRLRMKGQAGTCAACGYDLRATPDRCPECGAVASGADSVAMTAANARSRKRQKDQ